MDELKKCPFCGGEGYTEEHRFNDGFSTWKVYCTGCGCKARLSFDTKEEAIEAWNRRSDNGAD